MFKESKALRINKKINPKEREEETRKFFAKIFIVNKTAKKRGVKNNKIFCQFADTKLSG